MAGLRILGEGQLSLTKCLLLTDTPLRLQEFKPLLIHILERADFASDLFVFSPVSQDTLDYTSGRLNEGSKVLLMGLGEKRFELQSTITAELKNPIFTDQKIYAPGVLAVQGPEWKEQDAVPSKLLDEESAQHFRIIFLVDNVSECIQSDGSFLWTVFTRFEPASDIYSKQSRTEKFHIRLSAPLIIDCRLKPWYPPLALPSPETVAAVDARWKEFFRA
jgi:3-polyprenyl-4-hydroxybenzoate decarboxylase